MLELTPDHRWRDGKRAEPLIFTADLADVRYSRPYAFATRHTNGARIARSVCEIGKDFIYSVYREMVVDHWRADAFEYFTRG